MIKNAKYCDNPHCEAVATVTVPVSVDMPGDERRRYCNCCFEAYMIGRQHVRKSAEFGLIKTLFGEVSRFDFTNKVRGTGSSDCNLGLSPKFKGRALVILKPGVRDYETGGTLWCEAMNPELIEYMKKNASPKDQRVLVSPFALKPYKPKYRDE